MGLLPCTYTVSVQRRCANIPAAPPPSGSSTKCRTALNPGRSRRKVNSIPLTVIGGAVVSMWRSPCSGGIVVVTGATSGSDELHQGLGDGLRRRPQCRLVIGHLRIELRRHRGNVHVLEIGLVGLHTGDLGRKGGRRARHLLRGVPQHGTRLLRGGDV